MEMVMSTTNTTIELLLKPRLLHSLHHRTHYTPMSFHSKPTQEKDKLMTDPKLMDTTMEMVMLTPNTTDNGKDLLK